MSRRYNLKKIHNLLIEGFTVEEIRTLCLLEPDLKPLLHHLTENDSKIRIIQQLLAYVERKSLGESLLNIIKAENPGRFEQHQPYYEEDSGEIPRSQNPNPFVYGRPVSPNRFIGHQPAIKFCRTRLVGQPSMSVAINGERRIGKTSLLHYLRGHAADETWGQYRCLFLDCGIFGTALTSTLFWQEILHLLHSTLDQQSPLIKQISRLNNRPEVSGRELRRLLARYNNLHPHQPILLLLDEFEVIFQNYNVDVQNLLMQLRAITLDPQNRIVLVIATRDMLSKVCRIFTTETALEFQNAFQTYRLELFNQKEVAKVVRRLLALSDSDIEFTNDDLGAIWNLSRWNNNGSHPMFVQIAASLIFEHRQNHQTTPDYRELARQFEIQVNPYQQELPRQSLNYELGLSHLETRLPPHNSELTLKFYGLASRLRRILRLDSKHQLETANQTAFEQVLQQLNTLAIELTGLTLEQLITEK